MFQCKITNKGIIHFKNVFDLFKQMGISDAYLDVKHTGIYIYKSHDNSIYPMVYFSLSYFTEYTCHTENIYMFNINGIKNSLKNITGLDNVELKNTGENLNIKVIKKSIQLEYILALKPYDYINIPIPTVDDTTCLNIKSGDFAEFCKSINGKDELTIETNPEAQSISFASINFKTTIKGDTDEDEISTFEDRFRSEYFSKLKKMTKFDHNLKVYIDPKNKSIALETCIDSKEDSKITIWIKSLSKINEEYDEVE